MCVGEIATQEGDDLSGRGDDAYWRTEDAVGYGEQERKNKMLRREVEELKQRIFSVGTEPEKLPPISGPVTLADGTVVTPRATFAPDRQEIAPGVKFDQDKLRMDLLPPDAIMALATVLTDGAKKYGGRNWEQGMAWSRPYAALMRHLLAWWGGQDNDLESGHPHLWHVLTNAAFLVAYNERKIGEDDRP